MLIFKLTDIASDGEIKGDNDITLSPSSSLPPANHYSCIFPPWSKPKEKGQILQLTWKTRRSELFWTGPRAQAATAKPVECRGGLGTTCRANPLQNHSKPLAECKAGDLCQQLLSASPLRAAHLFSPSQSRRQKQPGVLGPSTGLLPPARSRSPALTEHTSVLLWPLLQAGGRRGLLPEMAAEDTDVTCFIPWLLILNK